MSEALPDAVLDRVFRTARTANDYVDRPVPETTLRALWDVMKWGPTSANQMPARIIWCVSDAAKEQLAACASATNALKIRAAPVAAVIGMDLEFYERLPELYPHTDARAWFVGNDALIAESALRNSSLQGAYFIVAARLLGLDVGPMSGFDAAKVDAAFFAGRPVRVNFIATLGYGDPASIRPRNARLSFDDATQLR